MANLKKALAHMPPAALVAKAEHVHAQLTAHAADFPAPSPSLAELAQAKDALLVAISDALDGGRRAHQAKRDAYSKLIALLRRTAQYVGNVANGDAQLIINGGFTVRATATPSHLPSAPRNLEARTPDVENAARIEWRGEAKVRLYQVQRSTQDPATGADWTSVAYTSKCKCTIAGLEPYRMYWFRVIALNTVGASLPSDVLMARAS